MKIICIGRNYRDHATELGNTVPSEPVFFLKPTTACLYPGQLIRLKPHLGEIHHEVELVVALGSDAPPGVLPPTAAMGLVFGFGVGLDLTRRDLQAAAKAKGLKSDVAGQANILVVPNIEVGDMLAKQLSFMAGAVVAEIVLGGQVPIILNNAAASEQTRVASAAIALALAHAKAAANKS
mgnify:CR=1 FL=1